MDSYGRYKKQGTDRTTDLFMVAATDDQTVITVRSANHRLYIQKIEINITTYSAKTWTFTDSANTPVPVALISIPAAAVALPSESNTITVDFGPKGVALTLGKNLLLDVSAAGAAGVVHVEAYEVLGATVAMASTN